MCVLSIRKSTEPAVFVTPLQKRRPDLGRTEVEDAHFDRFQQMRFRILKRHKDNFGREKIIT